MVRRICGKSCLKSDSWACNSHSENLGSSSVSGLVTCTSAIAVQVSAVCVLKNSSWNPCCCVPGQKIQRTQSIVIWRGQGLYIFVLASGHYLGAYSQTNKISLKPALPFSNNYPHSLRIYIRLVWKFTYCVIFIGFKYLCSTFLPSFSVLWNGLSGIKINCF